MMGEAVSIDLILWVPLFTVGVLMILGVRTAYISGNRTESMKNALYRSLMALSFFFLIHLIFAKFLFDISPWGLTARGWVVVETLTYLIPLFFLLFHPGKFSVDADTRTIKDVEHKIDTVGEDLKGGIGSLKKTLKGEKGVRKDVKTLKNRFEGVFGGTDGLEPLDRKSQQILEGLDSIEDDLNKIEKRTTGYLPKKVARKVSREVSGIPEETAEKTVESVTQRLSGMKEYEAGQDYQVKSMREFEAERFDEVKNYPSSSQKPDHILINAGQVVGAVEVRHKKITGSKTLKRSNFVTAFDYAREKGVLFILRWWNPATERLWLHVIEPEELKVEKEGNFKVTVPTWLWHSELDEVEEREMRSDLRKRGK